MGFQGNAISIGVAVFACACSEPPTEGAGRTITMPPSTAAAAAGNAAQMSSDSAPSTPSTGNSSSDAPLITPTTEVQTTSCRPGHYIGEFYGEYFSGAWLDGAEPLPFATADVDGKPGFEFWLEAVDGAQVIATTVLRRQAKTPACARANPDSTPSSNLGAAGGLHEVERAFQIALAGLRAT